MSTFDAPFEGAPAGEQKTSGLAIASLVCSLICCLPITTIPGILLGVAALVSIGNNPGRKGKGLAFTGIALGVLFTIGQAIIYPPAYAYAKVWMELVAFGPQPALIDGYGGDIAAFKAHFHGPGAAASDAEAQAFIDQLRDRYGEYQSLTMVGQNTQPAPGSPIVPFDYVLVFDNAQVDCVTEIAFADKQTGTFVNKLHSITVIDTKLGDLTYPPAEAAGVPEPAAPPPPDETEPGAPAPPEGMEPDEGDGG